VYIPVMQSLIKRNLKKPFKCEASRIQHSYFFPQKLSEDMFGAPYLTSRNKSVTSVPDRRKIKSVAS